MIRPILEYASATWSAYTIQNITKLEKVQRQSAQFVLNDYSRYSSVANMLNVLRWPTLENQRDIQTLILFYKILHNYIHTPSDYLVPSLSTAITQGYNQRFQLPFARTNAYKDSFFIRAINLWNNLPGHLVNQPTIQLFKSQLRALVL